MKRTWPMTHHKCCICGYGSLVKTNFKFDQQHNAYCVKNDHHLKVWEANSFGKYGNKNDEKSI